MKTITANDNGYPLDWLELGGSLADDERFFSPDRSPTRIVDALDEEQVQDDV